MDALKPFFKQKYHSDQEYLNDFAAMKEYRNVFLDFLKEISICTGWQRMRMRFLAVCICTSTERPEALYKTYFFLARIDEKHLLQAVDTAVQMNLNGDYGVPVPDYVEENVSTKVVKIIQSYTGVVNRWCGGKNNIMCGIVGFTGSHQAAPILLDGLSKLEYRGYDSAGLAVKNSASETEIVKAKGRLRELVEKTDDGQSLIGTCGIGHTRWATHGDPSEENAHPHKSDDENVIAVHNGIIENYHELKEKLLCKGYQFYSSTDTEVAVKLIDYYYKKYEGTPVDALNHAMVRIQGSYALAVLFRDYPEEIYVARKDSSMILGVSDGETYLASDVPAILKYTRQVYYIGNLEIAQLQKGAITFYNLDGDVIEKEPVEISWDAESAEKAGYEHFRFSPITWWKNTANPCKY